MTTPYRGYTEIPGAAVPDVPYRVNLALREIDADVADAVAELEAADTATAGRLAVVEAAAGFGSGMKLQDDAVNGLLNGSTATAATLTKQIETKGPAATVAALGVPASPTREAFDAHTLGHIADMSHGPMKQWSEALAARRTKPAIWVNLGSSTANGGTTRYTGQQWAQRVATWLTGRSTLDSAALPRLEGVTARPGTTGVWAYTGAIGGTQSSNYINAAMLAAIKALQPALITHMVGSNDYGSGITLAAYKANLRNWMDQLQAASPGTVHLYIHQQPRNDIAKPAARWAAYGKAMAEVAAAYPNAAYLDASAHFPFEGEMPGNIMAEGVHMDENGHKILADVIAAAMGNPITYATGEVYAIGLGATTSEPKDPWSYVDIPPARYPRTVKFSASLFGYGTAASPNSAPTDIHLKGKYTDTDADAGSILALRMTNGGTAYANPYAGTKVYHIDANRPLRLSISTPSGGYVSGNGAYSTADAVVFPA